MDFNNQKIVNPPKFALFTSHVNCGGFINSTLFTSQRSPNEETVEYNNVKNDREATTT